MKLWNEGCSRTRLLIGGLLLLLTSYLDFLKKQGRERTGEVVRKENQGQRAIAIHLNRT